MGSGPYGTRSGMTTSSGVNRATGSNRAASTWTTISGDPLAEEGQAIGRPHQYGSLRVDFRVQRSIGHHRDFGQVGIHRESRARVQQVMHALAPAPASGPAGGHAPGRQRHDRPIAEADVP